MHSKPALLITLSSLMGLSLAAPSTCLPEGSICPQTNKPRLTIDKTIKNWEEMWAGDFSLLNDTVMPDVQIYQDRLSIGNTTQFIPIQNSTALLNFMRRGRQGYDEYRFVEDFYFGNDNGSMVAGRWHLDAVSPTPRRSREI
ncbi:hypothetical protein PRZ48_013680 [Zasmidium cellare]|uniref:Uncharacterized protein n=1 Tax=Zasmidium cellare TaxID=395010 RepID=A0ABR0E1Q5_ZASCE|nr:hypothetical protein PRZ48_013680 [Zasmidium cellare]